MRVDVGKHLLPRPHVADDGKRQQLQHRKRLRDQLPECHVQVGREVRPEGVEGGGGFGLVEAAGGVKVERRDTAGDAEGREQAEDGVGDDAQRLRTQREHRREEDAHQPVGEHDVAVEQQEHVRHAEQRERAVAAVQHAPGLLGGVVLAVQAGRDQAEAEAQQRGEHRQAAHVDEHRGEHRADLVDHAIRAHAADGPAHPGLVLRPVVDHPPLGGVGHRDAQQGGAAREVRDDQAGALLRGLVRGLVLFGVGGFVHALKVPPQARMSHVCGYWPTEEKDVVECLC